MAEKIEARVSVATEEAFARHKENIKKRTIFLIQRRKELHEQIKMLQEELVDIEEQLSIRADLNELR